MLLRITTTLTMTTTTNRERRYRIPFGIFTRAISTKGGG